MPSPGRATVLVLLSAVALLARAPAPAGAASAPARVNAHRLLSSRVLWATIDVCSPKDQPNTVGIRGSMPGDGRAGDKLYMSFRLQYMDATSGHWVDLAGSVSSGYVSVGSAAAAREGGRSFQLVPVAGKPASRLRGVVGFQWRRGRTVLLKSSRASTAGHHALAGADPPGFSAASCLIG